MIDYFDFYKKDKNFLKHIKALWGHFKEIDKIIENLARDCPVDPKFEYKVDATMKNYKLSKKKCDFFLLFHKCFLMFSKKNQYFYK